MVLCALALIGGGTGLSSTERGASGYRSGGTIGCECAIPRGVIARSMPAESQWEQGSHKVGMTVPLTLAMAGG